MDDAGTVAVVDRGLRPAGEDHDLQSEWSLWTRDLERAVVPACRELGVGLVAYSPLGRYPDMRPTFTARER